MPWLDLASPTQVLLDWGWLLVTRANGAVYLLILIVLLLGMTIRLPRARRDIEAVESDVAGDPRPAGEAGDP